MLKNHVGSYFLFDYPRPYSQSVFETYGVRGLDLVLEYAYQMCNPQSRPELRLRGLCAGVEMALCIALGGGLA
jgi:hypothetical protein